MLSSIIIIWILHPVNIKIIGFKLYNILICKEAGVNSVCESLRDGLQIPPTTHK